MELAPVTELTESETEDFQAMVVDFVHFFVSQTQPNHEQSVVSIFRFKPAGSF